MGGFYYNSNGFAFHRIEDTVTILAELGYDGIALTPDVHHLDPFHTSPDELQAFRALLEQHDMGIVLETGARFVLDASRKHWPTLLDVPEDAHRRVEFLCRCVDVAVVVGAPIVTLWSGAAPDGLGPDAAFDRLIAGLRTVCTYAEHAGVRIGFEPEPGMYVERAEAWPAIRDAVESETLGLTLDVGHCLANDAGQPADVVRAHAADLLVLQLDDHRRGVHDHLDFGEGEVDFPALGAAVREIGFEGPLEVELSRHSATAPMTAAGALAYLKDVFSPDEHAG